MYIFYKIIQLKFKFSGTIDRKTWHALKARASQGNQIVYPVQVMITDVGGRLILEKQISGGDKAIVLSGTAFKSGIYLCRISNRDGVTESLKLVKIK